MAEPNAHEPDVTRPDVHEPDVTEPDVQEPNVTETYLHEPDVTEPDVNEPDVHDFIVEDTVYPADITSEFSTGEFPADETMSSEGGPMQQRLYVINRAGSGEAHHLLLTVDRTDILNYQVRTEHWKVIHDIAHFGVAVVDNILYIIGGYDKLKAKHLDRLIRYDPTNSTWTELSSMIKPRAKFATCVLDGMIYVCGGEKADGRVTGASEVYDPTTDEWTKAGMMISARANHSCAVFQRELYVAGGYNGQQSHNNFCVYEGNRWEELDKDYPHSLPINLDRFSMATVGNIFYFIGGVSCKVGKNGKNTFLTERRIFSYSSSVSAVQTTDTKGLIENMISPWSHKLPNMHHARHSAGVAVLGSKVYVLGGSNLETGQQMRIAEYFDTKTGEWEEDFRFRKGDVSNVTCAILEVPNKQDDGKVNFRLKWVMW